jgi:ABC-2 type transport system permease protein
VRLLFTIARHDLRVMLKEKETLLWLFVMPVLFFWFLGTVQSGMASGDERDGLGLLLPAEADWIGERLVHRLEAEGFVVHRVADRAALEQHDRRLEVPADLTAALTGTGHVQLVWSHEPMSGLGGDFDRIRALRAAYGLLADLVVLDVRGQPLTVERVAALDQEPRALTLEVKPAGKRPVIPAGFAQAIPGTLVMFTLMILLTGGGVPLVHERQNGLLRRLASAPLTRGQLVRGKALARLLLAAVQIAFGVAVGTFGFGLDWGPDLPMVLVVLAVWGALCAMIGLCAGNIARSSGQAVGLGIAGTMALAALGGCWWPIEITPRWMQSLAACLPTGWTMGAIHQLVSFQSGPASALAPLALLLGATVGFGWLAARTFRYHA